MTQIEINKNVLYPQNINLNKSMHEHILINTNICWEHNIKQIILPSKPIEIIKNDYQLERNSPFMKCTKDKACNHWHIAHDGAPMRNTRKKKRKRVV